ncbi:MAG: acylneuraminate cytidylyltransferase family protein [Desulfobacula sp.]|nr:acylneuraminate cytidylyltransferase family protein [Desulfobacula sp.]
MTDKKENIIAMIPARIGSTRLPKKNLALINGEPLISYAIKAAKLSGVFDRIVINADDKIFNEIAERYGVEFYHRPEQLGSSTTKSDDVVLDFIKKHPSDIIAWVNPTSPLQTGQEIKEVVNYFQKEKLDSLITTTDQQVHANFNTAPLNYKTDELFAQTQDLTPVELFVYSVMMWRTSTFLDAYETKQHAFFVGKVGFFPVSKLSSIIIKHKEDLKLAEFILKSLTDGSADQVEYDSVVRGI